MSLYSLTGISNISNVIIQNLFDQGRDFVVTSVTDEKVVGYFSGDSDRKEKSFDILKVGRFKPTIQ